MQVSSDMRKVWMLRLADVTCRIVYLAGSPPGNEKWNDPETSHPSYGFCREFPSNGIIQHPDSESHSFPVAARLAGIG